MTCVIHGKNCHPGGHAPGGGTNKDGSAVHPFRPGKTRRDHRSGSWARRIKNREADPGRNGNLSSKR